MNIFLVAHDLSPSRVLAALAGTLEGSKLFLAHAGREKIDVDAMRAAVSKADFVLIGMSYPEKNTEIETAAAQAALDTGVPYGFYSDAKGAWGREAFLPYRQKASLLLNALPDEPAQKVFPHARVVCVGNPLWEQYFEPADSTAVRKRLGASGGDFLILSPGMKDAALTCQMWSALVDATEWLVWHNKSLMIVLTRHPGDFSSADVYASIVQLGLELGIRISLDPEMTSDEIVSSADVIVQSQNSSIGLHGICRRIPVIDFYGPLARKRLQRISGDTRGQFAGTGAVREVNDASPASLAKELLNARQRSSAESQERVMPRLQRGQAISTMKQAIAAAIGRN